MESNIYCISKRKTHFQKTYSPMSNLHAEVKLIPPRIHIIFSDGRENWWPWYLQYLQWIINKSSCSAATLLLMTIPLSWSNLLIFLNKFKEVNLLCRCSRCSDRNCGCTSACRSYCLLSRYNLIDAANTDSLWATIIHYIIRPDRRSMTWADNHTTTHTHSHTQSLSPGNNRCRPFRWHQFIVNW